MIRLFTLFLSALLITMAVPSLADAKGTVKVGDTIPHDLNLKDQNGKQHSFSDLTGKNGMVLAFVRSVEWCPYCQKQVIELDKNKKKFNDLGYSVVTLSYDQAKQMEKFVTTNNPSITLLSDPRSEAIRAFGIMNDASAKGTMSYGIPHPGVYVIDDNKKVQAKFFEEGYQNRPTVRSILVKIEEMNKPPVPEMTMETMGTDPIPVDDAYIEIPQEELPPLIDENTSLEGVEAEAVGEVPQEEAINDIIEEAEAAIEENITEESMGIDVEILEPTINDVPEGAPEIPQAEPTRATSPDVM